MQQDPGDAARARHRHASQRRGGAWRIGSMVCAGLAGIGGLGACLSMWGARARAEEQTKPDVVTTPTAAQATSAVQSFLTSWSGSSLAAAARATDDAAAAQQALQGYATGLKASRVTFTNVVVGAPDPAVAHALRTTFHVSTMLQGDGTFSYDGVADTLVVNGKPVVHWRPSVLYPGLTSGQNLVFGSIPATAATVVDRHGTVLTGKQYPSLTGIISALQSEYAQKAQISPGQGVKITDASGKTVKVLKVNKPAVPGKISSTLDAATQAAAESAVNDPHIKTTPTDVVAIDYTTGQIRAVAFKGGDSALNGAAAPGSTMKMITSAALMDKAGVKPTDKVPCVKTTLISGQTFHNFQMESDPSADLTKDFAISCNTAFINEATSKLHSGDLRAEARDVFGIGDWKIGVPTTDGNVPNENGSENLIAAQAIGQGQVTMNTLTMASVVATIADGAFHQPIIVPGLAQRTAKQPISATTSAYIREMMVATATQSYGTAEPRMVGIPGGAKTGTAETATGTNGWFAAYDTANHLAVDALAVGGKEGVFSAGYVARDVMLAPH
ncbi:penicillin-binding transpeptidase domain-containing protein [Streptomyces silvisoli]|uniref:Penicillin-binding transpeptidase domain-containing protein n=1 Tax=Streptomyces silvisoli TaxID=3034235 RepID=A0ABT5ZP05_9ACTN|nr:penicillin-binding transpeptidase domain-containing protein [Streptomyces silvisoli]MDF3291558.1 penicillin-binding transpeptidase domain-containing protein [Streptomyces silvisoli]